MNLSAIRYSYTKNVSKTEEQPLQQFSKAGDCRRSMLFSLFYCSHMDLNILGEFTSWSIAFLLNWTFLERQLPNAALLTELRADLTSGLLEVDGANGDAESDSGAQSKCALGNARLPCALLSS